MLITKSPNTAALRQAVNSIASKFVAAENHTLDEAVSLAHAEAAASIKASGIVAQVEYLVRLGWDESDILFHLDPRHGLCLIGPTQGAVEVCNYEYDSSRRVSVTALPPESGHVWYLMRLHSNQDTVVAQKIIRDLEGEHEICGYRLRIRQVDPK